MKRIAAVMVLLLSCTFLCLWADSATAFFPSRHSANSMPVNPHVGLCAESSTSAEHWLVDRAMRAEFGYEWLESFVAQDFRAAAALLLSEKLAAVLPASGFVMSVAKPNADGSTSITVWLPDAGIDIVFAVKDGFISAAGF